MKRSVFVALGLVVIGLEEVSLTQAPTGPAKIGLGSPSSLPANTPATLDITLQDAAGRPAPADRDVQLRVATPNAKVEYQIVTVPKGASTARVNVQRERAGLSEVQVAPIESSSPLLAAVAEIAFTPTSGYAPAPPLSVSLAVTPRVELRAGLETGRLIARLLDRQNVPVPAERDLAIAFPGFADKLTPHPLRIATGEAYGEASLSSAEPGSYELNPVIVPASLLGSPIGTQRLKVEFVSPIVALRLLADPRYVKGLRRPPIKVKAGLIDGQGNWISSDKDRTVVLRVDPPSFGRLREGELTIKRDTSVSETVFAVYEEGAAKVNAIGTGLQVQEAEVEFRYAWTYFLLISGVAGIAGGLVQRGVQSKRTPMLFLIGAIVGAGCGALAYILAPLLVSVSLRPENLQNVSKWFEAFAWGFVGGGGGPKLVAKVFKL